MLQIRTNDYLHSGTIKPDSSMLSDLCKEFSRRKEKKLWEELDPVRNNLPWIVLGDFNCIRYPHEKIGGDNPSIEAMEDFNNCLHEVELGSEVVGAEVHMEE